MQGQKITHHDENAHMTAILEIPLSTEFKMRNIEDTEAAKNQLLAGGASGSRCVSGACTPQDQTVAKPT